MNNNTEIEIIDCFDAQKKYPSRVLFFCGFDFPLVRRLIKNTTQDRFVFVGDFENLTITNPIDDFVIRHQEAANGYWLRNCLVCLERKKIRPRLTLQL